MIHPITPRSQHPTDHPPDPSLSASRPHRVLAGAVLTGLLCAHIVLAGLPSPAAALCPKSHVLETMLTKVCWGCVFPFRLGGKTLISSCSDLHSARSPGRGWAPKDPHRIENIGVLHRGQNA